MITRGTVANVQTDRVVSTIPAKAASLRNNTVPATGNIFPVESRAQIQTQ